MWACYKGRLQTCQVLLDNGANPNVKGEVRALNTFHGHGFFLSDCLKKKFGFVQTFAMRSNALFQP